MSTRRNQMEINGLCVTTLHSPKALKSAFDADGKEIDQGLPPGDPRPAYAVADYERDCPEDWDRGGPGVGSYFTPVEDGHGLWLDFNANNGHRHDVAVVVSIQGVNALTGGRTKGDLGLEQYEEGTPCPRHGDPLGPDRHCRKCGYAWPAQNYLSTTGRDMPHGYFWLDGFRADDGVIRQFVFTMETRRGVAAQLIGQERVHALGIAFFLSKEEKPYRPHTGFRRNLLGGGMDGGLESMGPMRGTRYAGPIKAGLSAPPMEVAAGARVRQHVYEDPNRLSYWQKTPAGILYVNYADEATVDAIIGRRTGKTGQTEGFLTDVDTGHNPGSGNH